MNTYTPQVADKVECPSPTGGLQPYTGTVVEVFVGFVRVQFDKPQGGITTALTGPENLVLTYRAPNARLGGPQVFPGYTPPDPLAPVVQTPPVVHVEPPPPVVQPGTKPQASGKSVASADLQTGTTNENQAQSEQAPQEPAVEQSPASSNSFGAAASSSSQ
jgi:hypothetical protein